jgi:hypothetical protein
MARWTPLVLAPNRSGYVLARLGLSSANGRLYSRLPPSRAPFASASSR